MKFYINCGAQTPLYTFETLKNIINSKNHQLVNSPLESDIILFSLTGLESGIELAYMRMIYDDKYVLAGGPYSGYYQYYLQWCDAVNVGHGFECFDSSSISDLESKYCVATKAKRYAEKSNKIEWELFPLVSHGDGSVEYIHSFGCPNKNKCSYCYVGNNVKYQVNPLFGNKIKGQNEIYPICSNFIHKGKHNKIVYPFMTIKGYLATNMNVDHCKIGLDFATEKNRKIHTPDKYFTNRELIMAIEKAIENNHHLRIYAMGGIDKKSDWKDLFSTFPKSDLKTKLIRITFNNLRPEPLTKIDGLIIDEDNYIHNISEIEYVDSEHQYIEYVYAKLINDGLTILERTRQANRIIDDIKKSISIYHTA